MHTSSFAAMIAARSERPEPQPSPDPGPAPVPPVPSPPTPQPVPQPTPPTPVPDPPPPPDRPPVPMADEAPPSQSRQRITSTATSSARRSSRPETVALMRSAMASGETSHARLLHVSVRSQDERQRVSRHGNRQTDPLALFSFTSASLGLVSLRLTARVVNRTNPMRAAASGPFPQTSSITAFQLLSSISNKS